MNILVIGGGAWTDNSSLGNTFSNFFKDWGEDVEFFNLYFRGTAPQNYVCENYFSITDISIIKNLFNPERIGNRVQKIKNISCDKTAADEKRIINLIHKFGATAAYEVEDALWETGKWKNAKLDEFIEEASPDIIFTFASGNSNILRAAEYIKEKNGAKIVTFIADDVYNEHSERGNRRKRIHKKILELLNISDLIYGISEEICEKYSLLSGKEVFELKKSCDSFSKVKENYKTPLKIVYAGNLLYGRTETILKLSEAIEKINRNETKILLEIYSGTFIDEKTKKSLSINNASEFMGERPYAEIKKVLEDADVVLHAESFTSNNLDLVKYSFSTKIIDCLQSGNIIMAIGPEESSSINYVRTIPGAFVAGNYEEMESMIETLSKETDSLAQRAREIREFAINHHSAEKNRNRMKNDFRALIKNKNDRV